MKISVVIALLMASLGGCAIVPVDYGYRSDGYYRGDRYYRGYYRGDVYYYPGDRYYRSYSYGTYGYRDHGQ